MDNIQGTYRIHVGNYDWGCSVDQAIISLNEKITHITTDDIICVKERKMVTDKSTPAFDLYETTAERTVTDVCLCDAEGTPTQAPSSHISVKLQVTPEVGSPLVCTSQRQVFIWSDPYELLITCKGIDVGATCTGRTTDVDMFKKDVYVATDGTKYDYAYYSPAKHTDTLYVWLHGMGEGQADGNDAYLPLLGRKGSSMAESHFQDVIGGAHVLVPQCPTYWMDADGQCSNLQNGKILADGTSYYTESLSECIDAYAAKVGATKIALAGCSNGGYMCLVLALSAPDKYRAVVPICEAMPDKMLSDESIRQLAQVPLYFVYSHDDPVVPPDTHEIPTILRLKEAGASNLHVSVTDHVIDTSDTYKNKDGSPYQYIGHLSWIYYDNNETDNGNGLSAWEWLEQCLQ